MGRMMGGWSRRREVGGRRGREDERETEEAAQGEMGVKVEECASGAARGGGIGDDGWRQRGRDAKRGGGES